MNTKMPPTKLPPLNVGLIGFGRIAELVHLRTLMSLPGVVVGGVSEHDPKRMQQVWQRAPHAGTFANYHDMLRDSEVEAVVICLPPAQHADAAIAAFQSGKHVYIEKPIAPSLEEAQAIHAAWRVCGKVGMMGFNFRCHPLYQQLRSLIREGAYGAVIGASSLFATQARQIPAWKEKRVTGGGVLLDLASHHVDLVGYLFPDPIVKVNAFEHSRNSEADNATLALRLESGALIQSLFSSNSVNVHRFEVYFENAKIVVDLAQPDSLEVFEKTTFITRSQKFATALRSLAPQRLLRTPGYEPSFSRALSAFASAVRSGDSADNSLMANVEDGCRCLEVILAAEESSRTKKQVDLARFAVPLAAQ
jgi:predicted dehydrogenase